MKGGLLVLNWRSLLRVNQVTFSNSEIEATTVAISKPIWQIEAITVGNQILDYQNSENDAELGSQENVEIRHRAGEAREGMSAELGRRENGEQGRWE